jgi:hypothetical protein
MRIFAERLGHIRERSANRLNDLNGIVLNAITWSAKGADRREAFGVLFAANIKGDDATRVTPLVDCEHQRLTLTFRVEIARQCA